MPTTPLRSVIAQQVSRLLDLGEEQEQTRRHRVAVRRLHDERTPLGSPPALTVIPNLRELSPSPRTSASTTSAGSYDVYGQPSHAVKRGKMHTAPVSLPCTPSRRSKTSSICEDSTSTATRVAPQAEVDKIVNRLYNQHSLIYIYQSIFSILLSTSPEVSTCFVILHMRTNNGFSAARETHRDKLVQEYEDELRRAVTGRPRVDPKSRKMASDVPSIASRASKLLASREAAIAGYKERIGREEEARHTPVINRRSRSLARTQRDLGAWAEDVRRRKEQRQAQYEAELKATCTFAPNIYSRRGQKREELPVSDRLLRAAEVSKAKIEEKRKVIEAANMEGATFAPKITPHPSHSRSRRDCGPTGGAKPEPTRPSPEPVPKITKHARLAAQQGNVFERLTTRNAYGQEKGREGCREDASRVEDPADGKKNRWSEEITRTSPSPFRTTAGGHLVLSGRKQSVALTALGRLKATDEDEDSVEDFSPLRRIFQFTAKYPD
ncbi:hypothetical protein FOL47_003064 [Perkinsus chesapeaki]|uniref:Uncharacterized protein n=1 Tax=Perkinsus chesapeaki TaxID=330153 RepID=A0A7J6MA06_PERCH|nr:hypothetical protein FOL47_003064 [Perkinsus chesapeaki]